MRSPILLNTTSYKFISAVTISLILFFYCAPFLGHTKAQSSNEGWIGPINISNSGFSNSPTIVVDREGISHAVWLDELSASYRYSRTNADGSWTEPQLVRFPFQNTRPRLTIGPGNSIYAFWIDEMGSLLSVIIPSNAFSNPGLMTYQGVLAENVVAYDVYLENDQIFHLAYLVASDRLVQSSGVYYRRSSKGGFTWNAADEVFLSQYYRGMTSDQTNIDITFRNEPNSPIIAWTDPFDRQIKIFDKKLDNDRWTPTFETILSSASSFPSNVNIASWGNDIVAVWQENISNDNCSIKFSVQSSSTLLWTSSQTLLSDETSCLSSSSFILTNPKVLIWQVIINYQVIFMAWNGEKWSDPQRYPELSGYRNEISSTPLIFNDFQMSSSISSDRVDVVVQDENGNNDVWWFSRDLSDIETWFDNTSVWGKIVEITKFTTTDQEVQMEILPDSQGAFFHAFWTQPMTIEFIDPEAQSSDSTDEEPAPIFRIPQPGLEIFYSRGSISGWEEPISLFRFSPEKIQHLNGIINPLDRIYLTWQNENRDQIFITGVSADEAPYPQSWSSLRPIFTSQVTLGAHDIVIAPDKDIFITFAIPLNENRGIYLIRSRDGGDQWDQPTQVFNAQSMGWEMVDDPKIMVTQDGRIHVMWTQKKPLDDRLGIGMGYSFSDDQGITWHSPETINNQKNILWGEIVPLPEGKLLWAWQTIEEDITTKYYQVSPDNGETWMPSSNFANTGRQNTNPALSIGPDGTVHLTQIAFLDTAQGVSSHKKVVFQHLLWNTSEWKFIDDLIIDQVLQNEIAVVTSKITSKNQIVILASVADWTGKHTRLLAVTGKNFSPPLASSSVQYKTTPMPTQADNSPTFIPSSTIEVLPTSGPIAVTPTPTMNLASNEPGNDRTNKWAGLVFGSTISVVTIVVLLVLRKKYPKRIGRK